MVDCQAAQDIRYIRVIESIEDDGGLAPGRIGIGGCLSVEPALFCFRCFGKVILLAVDKRISSRWAGKSALEFPPRLSAAALASRSNGLASPEAMAAGNPLAFGPFWTT